MSFCGRMTFHKKDSTIRSTDVGTKTSQRVEYKNKARFSSPWSLISLFITKFIIFVARGKALYEAAIHITSTIFWKRCWKGEVDYGLRDGCVRRFGAHFVVANFYATISWISSIWFQHSAVLQFCLSLALSLSDSLRQKGIWGIFPTTKDKIGLFPCRLKIFQMPTLPKNYFLLTPVFLTVSCVCILTFTNRY